MSFVNGLDTLKGNESLHGPIATQPPKLDASTASQEFCKDMFMPKSFHTAIHDAKASVHQKGLQAVLFEIGKLRARGLAPISYGFVSGDCRGTRAQREKKGLNVYQRIGVV